jgi:hypothetical protein
VLSFIAGACAAGECEGLGTADYLSLSPAALEIDVSGLDCTVTRVEADVVDYMPDYALPLEVFAGGVLIDTADTTINLNSVTLSAGSLGGTAIDRVLVTSCEAQILEVRLY